MPKTAETMTDHDMLIRVDTKVDAITQAITDLRANLDGRVTFVENGLTQINKLTDEIQPRVIAKKVEEHDLWIRQAENEKVIQKVGDHDQALHDFKIRWKFIVTILVAIGALVGFLSAAATFALHVSGH